MPTTSSFARRRNHDGSIDSICYKCFRTVASAHTEAELQWAEKQHDCVPLAIENRIVGFANLVICPFASPQPICALLGH